MAAGNPEKLAPQLGVSSHKLGECFGTGLDVSNELVHLACTIINKAYHGDVDGG